MALVQILDGSTEIKEKWLLKTHTKVILYPTDANGAIRNLKFIVGKQKNL